MALLMGLVALACLAYVSVTPGDAVTADSDMRSGTLRCDLPTVLPSTLKVSRSDTRRPHGIV
jgi:hypothetical protein